MDKITIERETLLPCPFCGGEAEILTIPEDHPDAGAMFVQCCDSRCVTSSALLYPLMDDVRSLLVERWNRRAALAAQPAEPDMRHPKIQVLIGKNARQHIWMMLVEQLVENPNFETTSMDMEYWDTLHDKLKEKLTAQPAPAAVPPDERVRVLRKALADAIECVIDWAHYASPYFIEKHDLNGDLARLRAALEATQ